MSDAGGYEVESEWVHIQYAEKSQFVETYGFSGSQGMVNLEGIRMMPKDKPSKTLMLFMHPATTLQLLPMPQAIVKQKGMHILCGASRYAKNDTSLIFEKVALDMGAYVRHAKEVWGYENVILGAWSGGGSLGLFYQSQAENPTITETPAGDPIDLKAANLTPVDGIVFQAAHLARSKTMTDWIDPSVKHEDNPDDRVIELDLYDPRNPNKAPYDRDWLAVFRAAQVARNRKITAMAKDQLLKLKAKGGAEVERPFITHRTMAEPRFLDPTIDPNDREPYTCFLGNPETVNTGPVGMGRFSTLRSWLSQWSYDDSNADGEKCARGVTVPLLAVENSADDAVPQPHTGIIYENAASKDKKMHVIKGATHYYRGQPELLQEAVDTAWNWMAERNFVE